MSTIYFTSRYIFTLGLVRPKILMVKLLLTSIRIPEMFNKLKKPYLYIFSFRTFLICNYFLTRITRSCRNSYLIIIRICIHGWTFTIGFFEVLEHPFEALSCDRHFCLRPMIRSIWEVKVVNCTFLSSVANFEVFSQIWYNGYSLRILIFRTAFDTSYIFLAMETSFLV